MIKDTSDLRAAICNDPEAREALHTLVFLLESPDTVVQEDRAWRGYTDAIQAIISKQKRLLSKKEREAELTSEMIPTETL